MIAEVEKVFEGSFRDYLGKVESLGIVSGVVAGSKVGERRGYLWNILVGDFTVEDVAQPAFSELSHYAYEFDKVVAAVLPLRISNVIPSRLARLLERCKQQGIDTKVLKFSDQKSTL